MATGGEGPLRFCLAPPGPTSPLQGLLAAFLSQAAGRPWGWGPVWGAGL